MSLEAGDLHHSPLKPKKNFKIVARVLMDEDGTPALTGFLANQTTLPGFLVKFHNLGLTLVARKWKIWRKSKDVSRNFVYSCIPNLYSWCDSSHGFYRLLAAGGTGRIAL